AFLFQRSSRDVDVRPLACSPERAGRPIIVGAGVPDQSHKGIHGADPSRETILSGFSRQTTPCSSSVPVLGEPYDAALVTRAVHGDQHAWEKIVDRYLPLVNAIARSYGLPAADREDAA